MKLLRVVVISGDHKRLTFLFLDSSTCAAYADLPYSFVQVGQPFLGHGRIVEVTEVPNPYLMSEGSEG